MKQYIILAFCTVNSLLCMDKPIMMLAPHEWDAQAYNEGNSVQSSAFMSLFKSNRIATKDRTILDVGCGTGNISAEFAKNAKSVHGFDASNNMITFARDTYGFIKNLSFEHCFAEEFQSQKRYNLAIASFCVHWFSNQKQAFQRINDCLEIDGEFFATASTRKDQQSNTLSSMLEMIPELNDTVFKKSGKHIIDLVGCTYPSAEELQTMLQETGFEVITLKETSLEYTITKNGLKQLNWPIFSSRPIINYIPTDLIQSVFEQYIDILLSKMPKKGYEYSLCHFNTTVIHARKIKKQ